jgi:hypothetical protein
MYHSPKQGYALYLARGILYKLCKRFHRIDRIEQDCLGHFYSIYVYSLYCTSWNAETELRQLPQSVAHTSVLGFS